MIITGVLSNGKYLTTIRRIVVPRSSVCLALVGIEDYEGTAIFRNVLKYLPVDTA